jgi:hypothetical protein
MHRQQTWMLLVLSHKLCARSRPSSQWPSRILGHSLIPNSFILSLVPGVRIRERVVEFCTGHALVKRRVAACGDRL